MREFARITLEDTPGAFNTSPDAGEQVFISLPQDNSVGVRKVVNSTPLRSAGYEGRRVRDVARTYDVRGPLVTPLKPSQIQLITAILINLYGTNCKNLKSFSLEHGFFLEDGNCTPYITRYLGCKATGTIAGTNSGEGQNVMASLDITGMTAAEINTTLLPVPDSEDVPDYEIPFGFQDSAGHLIIGPVGNEVRTGYTSFSLNLNNTIKPFRAETPGNSQVDFKGREPSLTIANIYRSKADRVAYEARTPQKVKLSLVFGGYTVLFDLGANNIFDAPQDDLKISGDQYMQTITLQNMIDPATGNDIVVTVTPPTP